MAVKPPGKTAARQRFEVRHIPRRERHPAAFLDDGTGQRMLALPFQRVGRGQKFLLRNAIHRNDVRDNRFSGCHRPGLVERDDLDLSGVLKRLGGLEQNAVLRPQSVAHHDRHRGCKPQRAGAGNHQYGDRSLQSSGRRCTGNYPSGHHQRCDTDHSRHKDTGNLVRDPGDRRLRRGGIAHHLDNLRESRVLAHPRRFRPDKAGLIDRSGADLIMHGLVHRNGFTRQRGFVDGRAPFHDHAVHRNRLARLHDENIARLYLIDAGLDLPAVPLDDSRLRRHLHQILQRIRRAPLGKRFQRLADRDESGDHRRRFKIELIVIQRHQIRVRRPVGCHPCHSEQDIQRPSEGDAGPQGDQRVHVGSEMEERPESGDKEIAVDEYDDERKQHLQNRQTDMIVHKERRYRPAPHIVSHRDIHKDHKEHQGKLQAPNESRRLTVLQGLLLRSQPAAASTFFRRPRHRLCAVAGRLDRTDHRVVRRRTVHCHRIGQQ